jgi:hypothetical protein
MAVGSGQLGIANAVARVFLFRWLNTKPFQSADLTDICEKASAESLTWRAKEKVMDHPSKIVLRRIGKLALIPFDGGFYEKRGAGLVDCLGGDPRLHRDCGFLYGHFFLLKEKIL